MKYKKLIGQFWRYFLGAGVGYIFDFGTLILLTEVFSVNYLLSAAIAFTVGLIVVFIISKRFVFGDSKIKSKSLEFGLFAVIGIGGLGILTLLMWLLTDVADINYIISKVLATTIVYAWNFFVRRSLYHDHE
jgi:putative flippase GtrA